MSRPPEPFTSAEIGRERLIEVCAAAGRFLETYATQQMAAHDLMYDVWRAKPWWYRQIHEPPGGMFGSTRSAIKADAAERDLERVRQLDRIASTSDLDRIRLKDSDALLLRRWMAPPETDITYTWELS